MMNDAEKKFFNDNGYLLLKHVFSEEECAKFKASLFEEIEKGKEALRLEGAGDRKSTRLNYSHITSSYAVFCLTKKVAV